MGVRDVFAPMSSNFYMTGDIRYAEEPTEELGTALRYVWMHLPSAKQGESTVFVASRLRGLALLSEWNAVGRGDWFYRPAA